MAIAAPVGSKQSDSALEIRRDSKSASGYTLKYLSKRDIPPKSPVWSSLNPPPKSNKEPRIEVLLRDASDYRPVADIRLDVTGPLAESGTAYVKFGQWMDKADLLIDNVFRENAIRPSGSLAPTSK